MITFVENIESYIQSIGLSGDFGLFFVAMMITLGIVIGLAVLGAPRIIVTFAGIISLFMFGIWGWTPTWFLFALGIILFGVFYLLVKGGGRNVIDD